MDSIKNLIRTKDLIDKFVHKYGRLPTERDPDYLEMLRMSKYRILAVPDFKPAKCANCGSTKNDGRNYIDFGLEVDWYGIVYICGECLKDIAREMGLFTEYEKQLELRMLEIELLKNKIEQGVELPDKLVKAWEEFKEYYASLQLAGGNGPDSIPPSNHDNSVVQESNETESDKSGINEAKPRAAKSTSGSRSKNIRSLADLLDDSGK
jgi:hypothetical protein